MSFFQKIENLLKSKYKEFLISKINRNKINNVCYKNSTTTHSMNECCSMELSSATQAKKEEINIQVKEIVMQHFNTPEKLIQYIRTQGVDVYRINNAEKVLNSLGEEEGFLTPLSGYKAMYLNLLLSITGCKKFKFGLSTKEMFIFDTNNTEIYTIARALYKYTGYKNNMPGYDDKSQQIYKKLYSKRNHTSPFTCCAINEMYACKEAIARDMESINFTIDLSVEYENAKKAAKKLSEESINI